MPQKLLSVEEAGRALGVSRSTVWRMIKRGQLPSVRHHGRRQIPSSATRREREISRLEDLPPFTRDNPFFKLMGAFHSDGSGPGSSDKYAALFGPGRK